MATAAPASASASYAPLTGGLEMLGPCTVSAEGPSPANAHVTAYWTDGILITLQGGTPNGPVPAIDLVSTFTDADGNPVDMYGEGQIPASLVFVPPSGYSGPASGVGYVGPSITYVYTSGAPTFDASGTFSAVISGTFRIANNYWAPVVSLPHGGSFHVALVVAGQVLSTHSQVT